MNKLKKIAIKYTDSNSAIGKLAKKVSVASGGKGINDYYAGKGTKKEALKSAGKVALTAISLTGLGAAAKAMKIGKGAKTIIHNKGIPKNNTTNLTAVEKQRNETLKRLNKDSLTHPNKRVRKQASKAFNDMMMKKK